MDHILRKLEHESLREAYFLTVALILAFGIIQTSGTLMNSERPVVSVVSCSMYPSLGVGDILLVYGEKYENIEEGEVVVYAIKEANITVGGQQHFISDYNGGQTAETDAGEIKIISVMNDATGQAVGAVLEVDGERVQLREGQAVQVNGETVTLDESVGMNIPVVHRVTEKTPTHIETKGDNNDRQLEFEDNVRPEQIHGTMFFNIPRVGGLKILFIDFLGFEDLSGAGPNRAFRIDDMPSCWP